VIVEADGIPPTTVEWYVGVSLASLPLKPGHIWPVRVDRADPTHLEEDDDKEVDAAEESRLAGRAEAQRLAALLRDEPPTGG
jgi:hypothetical protein